MVIIFYDANQDNLHICSEHDVTKIVSLKDPNLMDYIPNDDILYVQNGHYITKPQFKQWTEGNMALNIPDDRADVNRFTGLLHEQAQFTNQGGQTVVTAPGKRRLYIHPTSNGTIHIPTIKTKNHPDGLTMDGKWDFVPVEEIGEDVLMENPYLRSQIQKHRLEVVDEKFVQENMHKKTSSMSPSQAALDEILVPVGIKAEAAARDSKLRKGRGSDVIEIDVD